MADRSHIHHMLMDLGLTGPRILSVFYAGSFLLVLVALAVSRLAVSYQWSISVPVWGILLFVYWRLYRHHQKRVVAKP